MRFLEHAVGHARDSYIRRDKDGRPILTRTTAREIGRERRARTRAQLVEAARFLFTSRPIASVTVEDVTKQARLAKGTFYSHFRQLDEGRGAPGLGLSGYASMSTAMMRMHLTAHTTPTNTVLRDTPTGALSFVTKTE
jgi:hypothetical protein